MLVETVIDVPTVPLAEGHYRVFKQVRPMDNEEMREIHDFATLSEAMTFARGLRAAGWLRGEIDVQDFDGSMNVSL